MSKAISIIIGSKSDLDIVQTTLELLREFNASFDIRVLSAHRTPKEVVSYVEKASKKETKVFIAAAGGAAALAGVIAAHTTLPVIGIPIETKSLKGLDSLLSTVQMPAGVPVACMSIGKGGAENAALFALQVLSLSDKKIKTKLVKYKQAMALKLKNIKLKI